VEITVSVTNPKAIPEGKVEVDVSAKAMGKEWRSGKNTVCSSPAMVFRPNRIGKGIPELQF
jgi:hypothetical protein